MEIRELAERLDRGEVWEAEIRSLTPMTYVVSLALGDHKTVLQEAGTSKIFRNAIAAGNTLAEAGVKTAWLLHQSVDDELSGSSSWQAGSTRTPMRLTKDELPRR